MIGDDLFFDIEMAKKSGLNTIYINVGKDVSSDLITVEKVEDFFVKEVKSKVL